MSYHYQDRDTLVRNQQEMWEYQRAYKVQHEKEMMIRQNQQAKSNKEKANYALGIFGCLVLICFFWACYKQNKKIEEETERELRRDPTNIYSGPRGIVISSPTLNHENRYDYEQIARIFQRDEFQPERNFSTRDDQPSAPVETIGDYMTSDHPARDDTSQVTVPRRIETLSEDLPPSYEECTRHFNL